MNKIKDFYQSFGFIVFFMVMVIVISATMGQKFLSRFLMIVLASQMIFNADIFIELLQKFQNTNKAVNQNTQETKQEKKPTLDNYSDFIIKT